MWPAPQQFFSMKRTANVIKSERQTMKMCRLRASVLWVFATSLLGFAGVAPAAESHETTSSTLCVMTYNLRFASPKPPNAWPDRRPLLRECIELVNPDVLGTQEGVYTQLKDLAVDLPQFDWIGLGRDGGSKGEFMAVFYRKSRLEPVAFDHFWLSDTPRVIGSSTWGNSNRRMVTWVRFRDRITQNEVFFINTHFDHEVQSAREKSSEAVRGFVQTLDPSLPVILVGDFNARAGANKSYEILTGDTFFHDTWITASQRQGEGLATFNGFKALAKDGSRIDWILTRGITKVLKSSIVDFTKEGKFPSDHLPVVTWLEIPNQSTR